MAEKNTLMGLDLHTVKTLRHALVKTKDRLSLIAQTSMKPENADVYIKVADWVYSSLDDVLAAFVTLLEADEDVKKGADNGQTIQG